jgi:uncharacterized protein YaaR (DUF327 family)
MARIDSLGESSPFLVPERKKAQKKGKARSASFSELVESVGEGGQVSDQFEESDRKRTIEELLDGVFSSGETLKKLPTMENVKEYRRRAKAFVKYVVSRMLAVKETSSGANILKRKRFTLVEVIDKHLENLAVSVLSSQRDQIAILAKVDEINGLLVDLVT